MSPREVAQTMLDKYGFFVVCYQQPIEIGSVQTKQIGMEPVSSEVFTAQFYISNQATEEDLALQCAIMGIDSKFLPTGFIYRAVAE